MLKSDGSIKTSPLATITTCKVEPLDPGDVVFAFSDGIGEFLSLEEVVTIVRDNHLLGAEAIELAIRSKLKEYPKKHSADAIDRKRRQAARPDQQAAKNWDPSGADIGCIDDMAFFVLYAKPDPEAILGLKNPNDTGTSATTSSSSSPVSSSSASRPADVEPLPNYPVFSSDPPATSSTSSSAASSSTNVENSVFSSAPATPTSSAMTTAATSSSSSSAASSSTSSSNDSVKVVGRLDLDILEKRWVGLHNEAQMTHPYNPDHEPMFYGQLSPDTGEFSVGCMTRERFRTDAAKTTQEVVEQQQKTPIGSIKTLGSITKQGERIERFYFVGPQFIAEQLVAKSLTTQDKIRCWPIRNALKAKIVELSSQGSAHIDEIQYLTDLIQQLSPDEGLTGGHYLGAVLGVNVCDHVSVNAGERVCVLIDGVGHGDPSVVTDQFPIYRNMVSQFTDAAKPYTSIDTFADWMRNTGEEQLQATFVPLRSELHAFRNTYQAEFSDIVNTRLGNIQLDATRAQKSIEDNFSETHFQQLCEAMGEDNIRAAIQYRESGRHADEHQAVIIDLLTTMQANNYSQFVEKLASASTEAIASFRGACALRRTVIGGNSAVFAKIIETKDGHEFLYTGQWGDCCYFVRKSNGSTKKWSAEQDSQSGLGDHKEGNPGTHASIPLEPGDVVFAFSDGIGEYLSREELEQIVNDNYLSGTAAINTAIRKQLETHTITQESGRYSKDRKMASNPNHRAKNWDAESVNANFYDDMGFFMLFAKSESEAAATKKQVKEEPQTPKSWWGRIRGR